MSNIDDLLREYIAYDETSPSGLRWIKDKGKVKAGTPAMTSANRHGYLRGRFNQQYYRAHRVVWFLFYGEWPYFEIDHINRDRTDNRIHNLRDVTHKTNCNNRDRSGPQCV